MKSLNVRRLGVAGLANGVLLATMLAPAPAVASADRAEGTCTIVGRLTFATPIGNEPHETRYEDRATGTCDGTVNGVRDDDAPVVLRAKGVGTLSCVANRGVSHGTLTFTHGTSQHRDDVTIDYIAESTGALSQFVSRIRGRKGGESVAEVDFLTLNDEETLSACADGTLESIAYRSTGTTITPLVG